MNKTPGNKTANHIYSHQKIKSKPKSLLDTKEAVSIKQYNQEINEAEEEFERGEYVTNEEMKKMVNGWE